MNNLPAAPAIDVNMDNVAVPRAMNKIIAPAADTLGGVGVWEAVRMQR